MVGTLRYAHPTPRLSTPSMSHRERDETERADDHAPPCEQRKAVTGDIAQKRLHDDNRGDERHDEADRDDPEMIGRHFGATLEEIIGEGPDHGRNGEKKGKLRRRALVGTEQHRRDDACAGTRYAGDHRQTLRDADPEISEEREPRRVMLMRLVVDLV